MHERAALGCSRARAGGERHWWKEEGETDKSFRKKKTNPREKKYICLSRSSKREDGEREEHRQVDFPFKFRKLPQETSFLYLKRSPLEFFFNLTILSRQMAPAAVMGAKCCAVCRANLHRAMSWTFNRAF